MVCRIVELGIKGRQNKIRVEPIRKEFASYWPAAEQLNQEIQGRRENLGGETRTVCCAIHPSTYLRHLG